MPSIHPALDQVQQRLQRVEAALERWLPAAVPTTLHQAMSYAVLGGGKRIRPLLVYGAGQVLGVDPAILDDPACSVELIHAYSLVHDDLPVMDNDDLRRGKPTCHKAYGEATALLAGDALQALAFQVLAQAQGLTPEARVAMVQALAEASGSQGMVGGQAIDLAAEGQQLSLSDLEQMHLRKTGALIRASVLLGVYAAPQASTAAREQLDQYAQCIGLAFQIQDDVLDVEGTTEVIGKRQGADVAHQKSTYPALMGLIAAKKRAEALYQDALASLANFDNRADLLRWLAQFIIQREC